MSTCIYTLNHYGKKTVTSAMNILFRVRVQNALILSQQKVEKSQQKLYPMLTFLSDLILLSLPAYFQWQMSDGVS